MSITWAKTEEHVRCSGELKSKEVKYREAIILLNVLCDPQLFQLLSYQGYHHAVDVFQACSGGAEGQTISLDL